MQLPVFYFKKIKGYTKYMIISNYIISNYINMQIIFDKKIFSDIFIEKLVNTNPFGREK